MNSLTAKYKILAARGLNSFECQIDSCTVSFHFAEKSMDIIISGPPESREMEHLLADIESLLFIYWGSFPSALSICIDGNELDLSDRINKYITSTHYTKKSLSLCEIGPDTINEATIIKYRQLKKAPLYSLQYIVSSSYASVLIEHKITLLLHVVEGLIPKSTAEKELPEIIEKYSFPPKQNIGDYFAAVYHLCNRYFFIYDDKYDSSILDLFETDQRDFVQMMADTRNWYSHFLAESEKKKRLKNGSDMIVCFEILYYALRLMVMKNIGITPIEFNIKEFYFSCHDWIAKIHEKAVPLKSIAYSTIRMIEDTKRHLKD